MGKTMNDIQFIERKKVDVFTYLYDVGSDTKQFDLVFEDGVLEKVEHADGLPQNERSKYEVYAAINQMITNAEKQIQGLTFPTKVEEPEPIEEPEGFQTEVVDKSELENQKYTANRKINAGEVIYIRRAIRNLEKTTLARISDRVGLSRSGVSMAAKGETWKHVTEEPPVTDHEYSMFLEQSKHIRKGKRYKK